jgi:hypothetical protein
MHSNDSGTPSHAIPRVVNPASNQNNAHIEHQMIQKIRRLLIPLQIRRNGEPGRASRPVTARGVTPPAKARFTRDDRQTCPIVIHHKPPVPPVPSPIHASTDNQAEGLQQTHKMSFR